MAVREGLLALVGSGVSSGYQLKTAFEAATGGVWSLNVGQVYTTLDRLQRDGLVAVEEDDGQKRYSLTASGREELGGWWEAVPGEGPPPRDELLVKVLLAVRTGRRDHALAVITRHRTALTRLLQHRRRARGGVRADADLAAQMAADALTVRAEADLRWLDLCEARLLRAADSGGAS